MSRFRGDIIDTEKSNLHPHQGARSYPSTQHIYAPVLRDLFAPIIKSHEIHCWQKSLYTSWIFCQSLAPARFADGLLPVKSQLVTGFEAYTLTPARVCNCQAMRLKRSALTGNQRLGKYTSLTGSFAAGVTYVCRKTVEICMSFTF